MLRLSTITFRAPKRRASEIIADAAVLFGTFTLLYLIAMAGTGMLESFKPPEILPSVSLDYKYLPYYAARSTLRMFIALFFSMSFALSYGYIAAKNHRSEKIMIPLLDVLQSVPILGFLSITVTGFIAMFPGSLMGLEMASIFAIFTSQAWNLTFSFYYSLKMIPPDLDEAIKLSKLSGWQRFINLEIPVAIIGLVWNGMISFGGGWFFVAASEAISVLNKNYMLPGLGAYVTLAVVNKDLNALIMALLTIAIVVVLVDQLFWKPLVAWADKFKLEQSRGEEVPQSWVLNLFQASRVPRIAGYFLASAWNRFNRMLSKITTKVPRAHVVPFDGVSRERLFNMVLCVLITFLVIGVMWFVLTKVGINEVLHAFLRGTTTFLRVVVLITLATLFWVPIGVMIGLNSKLARIAQPIVLLLASFPANFLFPAVTIVLMLTGIHLNFGSIFLMALGSQWYLLFNTIAGASSIPTDLREMSRSMQLKRWKLWKAVIIPAIFPHWVLGGITASGGAWNASIVAEVVTWGNTKLTAYGLGSYIAQYTQSGDWPRIVLGVCMMSVFVIGVNRLVWHPLHALAENKYSLGYGR